jgi:hypothetical protein
MDCLKKDSRQVEIFNQKCKRKAEVDEYQDQMEYPGGIVR